MTADAVKARMAASLKSSDPGVLNGVGPFASLYRLPLDKYERPVLVFKTDEPGSKQKLAMEQGRLGSLCQDLIHHLLNDVLAMGAMPLVLQDAIICGRLEAEKVEGIVKALADACRAQHCSLIGGETSEQPGVLAEGIYVLTASCIGLVEEDRIVDGKAIREGDRLLALASNGLHTNGYSLVRALLEQDPSLADHPVDGTTFLEAILTPHLCYRTALSPVLNAGLATGLAHITGGGIAGNVRRIMTAGLSAQIDLSRLEILPIFNLIRERAGVDDAEMLKTFNLGAGMVAVVRPEDVQPVVRAVMAAGVTCYDIGNVSAGVEPVTLSGSLEWK